MAWIDACALDDVAVEDVRRFDHAGHSYAICRDAEGVVFAIDGLCTHARVHLADGLVTGRVIECPKHNGRFDIATGAPKGGPVRVPLRTYPARVEGGRVLLGLDEAG